MAKDELIDAIMREMDRVWGSRGLHGTDDEYQWLLEHYGITREEDNRWMDVLYTTTGDLSPEQTEDEGRMRFLSDDRAVRAFLEQLLQKYTRRITKRPALAAA
jgi:uncharacterized protein YifE (UPF0438 family)